MFRKNGDSWPVNVVAPEPTEEKIIAALRAGENAYGCDYGRCVYRMNNDVVDHQVVTMQLADDVTVSFTMTAFTAMAAATRAWWRTSSTCWRAGA